MHHSIPVHALLLFVAVLPMNVNAGDQPKETSVADTNERPQPEERREPIHPASIVSKVWLNPGPETTEPRRTMENPYAGDSKAVNEGKRLYGQYHCAGCHAPNAGGAYGPSLRDEHFIYGGDAVSMFQSIWHGRPNGMPTWAGQIPEDEIWKMIAYLHSLHDAGADRVTRGDN